VGCGLYNVKAYAVSQRKCETALVSRFVRNHAGMRTDARGKQEPNRPSLRGDEKALPGNFTKMILTGAFSNLQCATLARVKTARFVRVYA
jgi:hypothetical protein